MYRKYKPEGERKQGNIIKVAESGGGEIVYIKKRQLSDELYIDVVRKKPEIRLTVEGVSKTEEGYVRERIRKSAKDIARLSGKRIGYTVKNI